MSHRSEKFTRLAELGAGDFAHLTGSLEAHFIGVHDLLAKWGARPVLCDAGLYHAAYGTTKFTQIMVPLERRGLVAAIIGGQAEAIVYRYCSCDRVTLWPTIGSVVPLPFLDRFTGETIDMSLEDLRDFCELTIANSLQIAVADPAIADKNPKYFFNLCHSLAPYLSGPANRFARSLFPSLAA
jgi:hypothetical protein